LTEEHRRNKSIITPCTLKYSLFLQITESCEITDALFKLMILLHKSQLNENESLVASFCICFVILEKIYWYMFGPYDQFLPFFFSQFFNLKNNITTVLTESCEIWTSTDIPNACRHIIVLYVSDTWTKLYMNNQYFVLYNFINFVWTSLFSQIKMLLINNGLQIVS
jgi:hypothetical protein